MGTAADVKRAAVPVVQCAPPELLDLEEVVPQRLHTYPALSVGAAVKTQQPAAESSTCHLLMKWRTI